MDLVDVQRFKECNGFAFPGSRTTAQLLQRANSNGEACPTVVEWSNAVYRWMDLRWETLNRGNANNFPVNRCYVHSVPVALMLQGSRVLCILLLFISGMFPPLVLGKTSTLTQLWDISDSLTAYLKIVMENHFEILRHPSSRHSMQAIK